MHTRLSLLLVVTLFITPFVVLQAQTTSARTSAGILDKVTEEVSGINDTVVEYLPGSPNKGTALLQKKTETRIINLAANISNRLDGVTARLQNISGRLSARIEIAAADGYDVSAARASLAAANAALNDAKNNMSGIDEAVHEAIGSTDPRRNWQPVRSRFTTARDSIKTAHGELKNTVAILKSSSIVAKPSNTEIASSTPQ